MNHQSNYTHEVTKFTCPYCSYVTESLRGLSQHCKRIHKINGEILFKELFPNARTTCSMCQSQVKFLGVSNGYCKTCKKCSKIKQSRHGSIPWNKGLTKETSQRVKNASKRMKEHYEIHGHHRTGKTKETDEFLKLAGKKISSKMKEHYKTHVHHRTGKTKENCEFVREAGKKISKKLKGKKLSDDHKRKLSEIKTFKKSTVIDILDRHEFELIGKYSHSQSKITVKCKKCNNIEEKTLHGIQYGSTCNVCDPLYVEKTSRWQNEIYEFMMSICPNDVIIMNSREELDGLEIDVYNKTKKIGIECHGLYWHSDKTNKFHRYHTQLKDDLARKKGIKLIQIYEDEWRDKKEIVESIIRHRHNLTHVILDARKLSISTSISASRIRTFFNENHLEGAGSNSHISSACLTIDNEIIAALTLKRGNWGKSINVLELSRFCTKRNTHVRGSFSRCFSHAIKSAQKQNLEFDTIRTYIDKRIGGTSSYELNGFKIVDSTRIRFWWTNFQSRFNRFKFRAKDGMSEKDVAINAGMHKIYGCENFILEYKF